MDGINAHIRFLKKLDFRNTFRATTSVLSLTAYSCLLLLVKIYGMHTLIE